MFSIYLFWVLVFILMDVSLDDFKGCLMRSLMSCNIVDIRAGLRGNWLVNQEPEMAQMLLKLKMYERE